LGGFQTIENEQEWSDIQKREGPGGPKSQAAIEREGLAIERIERTTEDPDMAHKNGQNWISVR
jgi:hypothetical protein